MIFDKVPREVYDAEVERRITAEAREKVLTEQLAEANRRIDFLLEIDKPSAAPTPVASPDRFVGRTPDEIFHTPAFGKADIKRRNAAMYNAQKRIDAANRETKLSEREEASLEERIGANGNG